MPRGQSKSSQFNVVVLGVSGTSVEQEDCPDPRPRPASPLGDWALPQGPVGISGKTSLKKDGFITHHHVSRIIYLEKTCLVERCFLFPPLPKKNKMIDGSWRNMSQMYAWIILESAMNLQIFVVRIRTNRPSLLFQGMSWTTNCSVEICHEPANFAGEVSRDNTNKSNDTNDIGRYIVANQNTNIHFTGSKLVKPSLVSNVGGPQKSRCQVIKNKTAMKHGIFMVFKVKLVLNSNVTENQSWENFDEWSIFMWTHTPSCRVIHQLAHNMALTHGPMFSMTLGPNQGSPASLAVVLFGSGLLHGFLVSWGSWPWGLP